VFISRGFLPKPMQAIASADSSGAIRFDWINQAILTGVAQPTDKVVLVAYCPEYNRSVYRKGASRRSAMTDTLSVSGFKSKVVYTWLAFVSEDGRDVSDSMFTGQLTIKE
jgi:hypothetical protein